MWGDEADGATVPRGVVHRGYAGGAILPPPLPNEHVDPARAAMLGEQLRARYQAGRSVRQLAVDTGYSLQRVRSLLQVAETPMRSRGRSAPRAEVEGELF